MCSPFRARSGILSVILLGRTLGPNKWLGIVMLSAGVATVQVAGMQGDDAGADLAADAAANGATADGALFGLGGKMFGLVTILFAAGVSSCAGVYFEKILKGVQVSLWTRNLQLAFYSVVVGVAKLMFSAEGAELRVNGTSSSCRSRSMARTSPPDARAVRSRRRATLRRASQRVSPQVACLRRAAPSPPSSTLLPHRYGAPRFAARWCARRGGGGGRSSPARRCGLEAGNFFLGYTSRTWLCIATNAFGGLLVGMVIKYADAVLKDVALGASIAVSALVSTMLFDDFELSALFCGGVAMVRARAHASVRGSVRSSDEARPNERRERTARTNGANEWR